MQDDGSDSLAEQIATDKHWSDLRILILVVSIHTQLTRSIHSLFQCDST